MKITLKEVSNLNDNFYRWFGKSKVVDKNGKPLVVHHGTKGEWEDTTIFIPSLKNDIGSHFGTKDQANKILIPSEPEEIIDLDSKYYKYMRMMPCYLKIENPLYLEDLLTWDMDSMGDTLTDLYIMDDIEVFKLSKLYRRHSFGAKTRTEESDDILSFIQEKIIRALKKAGYDGIIYENQTEGVGESFMVFRPNQIKSIFNKGTWNPKSSKINENIGSV